jgi:hypothetical protein
MAKHFRWLFVGLLSVLPFVGVVAGPTRIGVWAEWSNDHYSFGGGTQPWALSFSALVIGLYLLLMYAVPSGVGKPLPGVMRRFVAFWLDFVLAMMAIAPIFGVVPTLTEWRRTGVFEWVFERPNAAPGDGYLIAAQLLVSSVALVFYYSFPLVHRRPSPGTCRGWDHADCADRSSKNTPWISRALRCLSSALHRTRFQEREVLARQGFWNSGSDAELDCC